MRVPQNPVPPHLYPNCHATQFTSSVCALQVENNAEAISRAQIPCSRRSMSRMVALLLGPLLTCACLPGCRHHQLGEKPACSDMAGAVAVDRSHIDPDVHVARAILTDQ